MEGRSSQAVAERSMFRVVNRVRDFQRLEHYLLARSTGPLNVPVRSVRAFPPRGLRANVRL